MSHAICTVQLSEKSSHLSTVQKRVTADTFVYISLHQTNGADCLKHLVHEYMFEKAVGTSQCHMISQLPSTNYFVSLLTRVQFNVTGDTKDPGKSKTCTTTVSIVLWYV